MREVGWDGIGLNWIGLDWDWGTDWARNWDWDWDWADWQIGRCWQISGLADYRLDFRTAYRPSPKYKKKGVGGLKN